MTGDRFDASLCGLSARWAPAVSSGRHTHSWLSRQEDRCSCWAGHSAKAFIPAIGCQPSGSRCSCGSRRSVPSLVGRIFQFAGHSPRTGHRHSILDGYFAVGDAELRDAIADSQSRRRDVAVLRPAVCSTGIVLIKVSFLRTCVSERRRDSHKQDICWSAQLRERSQWRPSGDILAY